MAAELGVALEAVVVGDGCAVQDLYGDWMRQREVEEDGAILVRPDKHIAWRSMSVAEDPERELVRVLGRILDRPEVFAPAPATAGEELGEPAPANA